MNGYTTEPFRATWGLHQGCVLSPTLFNLFINDLPLSLKNQTKGVKHGNLSLHSLLKADDLAILADNITDMQRKLEKNFDWCTTWGIQVNATKLAIIHFRPKTHRALYTKMHVRGQNLDFVSEYKYLGVILDEFLSFQKALILRTEQANRAFLSLCSQLRKVGELPARVYRKLYDSLVAPVLDYEAPIWSHYCSTTDLEKVQNRLYLGVGRKHPLAAAAGDMCWMPTKWRHQLQTLSFWHYILQKGENRISKRVFLECKKKAEEEHIRNWVSVVRCILAECNLLPWWQNNSCGNGLNHREFRNVVSCCLFRSEREKWKTEMIAKPKLRTCNFQGKIWTWRVYWVDTMQGTTVCSGTTQRKYSATRDWNRQVCIGIPAEQRICKLCRGAVEDEVHFCITCLALVLPRIPLLQAMDSITPGFKDLCDRQKLIKVMHAANKDHKVVNSLFNLFMARNQLLNK